MAEERLGFALHRVWRKLSSSFFFLISSDQILTHCNRCRYCSSRENLTIDHIIPISRGGKWEWENLVREFRAITKFVVSLQFCVHVSFVLQVTACARCNSRKGQKTLEQANMKLRKTPRVCNVLPCWFLIAPRLWLAAISRRIDNHSSANLTNSPVLLFFVNCIAGAQGVRHSGCTLDQISIQDAQEKPGIAWSVAAVSLQAISMTTTNSRPNQPATTLYIIRLHSQKTRNPLLQRNFCTCQ